MLGKVVKIQLGQDTRLEGSAEYWLKEGHPGAVALKMAVSVTGRPRYGRKVRQCMAL